MATTDLADDILNSVYDNFENKKKLQKEQDEREKEMCKLLIDQIKDESDKTLEIHSKVFNKFLTPEGEAFISKMTKGREELRNALLNSIEKLEKRVEEQKNIKFTELFIIFKYNLIELNRTYYNSFEFMTYLMFK
jgi:histidinol dehydrogenase